MPMILMQEKNLRERLTTDGGCVALKGRAGLGVVLGDAGLPLRDAGIARVGVDVALASIGGDTVAASLGEAGSRIFTIRHILQILR